MTIRMTVHHSSKGIERREILRYISRCKRRGAEVHIYEDCKEIPWNPAEISRKPDGYRFKVVLKIGEENNGNGSTE